MSGWRGSGLSWIVDARWTIREETASGRVGPSYSHRVLFRSQGDRPHSLPYSSCGPCTPVDTGGSVAPYQCYLTLPTCTVGRLPAVAPLLLGAVPPNCLACFNIGGHPPYGLLPDCCPFDAELGKGSTSHSFHMSHVKLIRGISTACPPSHHCHGTFARYPAHNSAAPRSISIVRGTRSRHSDPRNMKATAQAV